MYLWSALISGSALAVGLIDGRATVGLILLAALGLFLATALPALDRWQRGDEEPPPRPTRGEPERPPAPRVDAPTTCPFRTSGR